MGFGGYSSSRRTARAASAGFYTKSAREIFKERAMNNAMNPYDLSIRESRDSEEHPESVSIILALDITGSMGSIPHFLVKEGLPHIIETIIKKGIKDPQLLFLGIGDHIWDQAPLQVGQFESSDELLDHWLTKIWIEGMGGGNFGESYSLAWYVASNYTSIDCFEKRNHKGFLFTVGDEPVLKEVNGHALKKIFGPGEYRTYTDAELLEMAREKYEVYHLHLKQGQNGRNPKVIAGWKEIMGENLLIIDNKEDVANRIADTVINNYRFIPDFITENDMPSLDKTEDNDDNQEEEMIL